jgi:hypothetical protein
MPYKDSETRRNYKRKYYGVKGRELQKSWLERNPGYMKRWRSENPIKGKIKQLKAHGITLDEFEGLLELQGGVCAICGQSEKLVSHKNRRVTMLQVDHDHTCCPHRNSCGHCIRGLLCSRCNTAIGFFLDDPNLLRRAADYIENN